MSKSDESPALKRPGFFDGRLLTPEDFQREQQYVREKLKRITEHFTGSELFPV